MNAVERAADVIYEAWERWKHGLLQLSERGGTDEWVHISAAGYTSADMYLAWSEEFQWCADRVEASGVDAEYVPYDNPGVEGADHAEAFGSWLNDYDADAGRVSEDGEYQRPQLLTDAARAVIEAAEAWLDSDGHYITRDELAAAVRARREAQS